MKLDKVYIPDAMLFVSGLVTKPNYLKFLDKFDSILLSTVSGRTNTATILYSELKTYDLEIIFALAYIELKSQTVESSAPVLRKELASVFKYKNGKPTVAKQCAAYKDEIFKIVRHLKINKWHMRLNSKILCKPIVVSGVEVHPLGLADAVVLSMVDTIEEFRFLVKKTQQYYEIFKLYGVKDKYLWYDNGEINDKLLSPILYDKTRGAWD